MIRNGLQTCNQQQARNPSGIYSDTACSCGLSLWPNDGSSSQSVKHVAFSRYKSNKREAKEFYHVDFDLLCQFCLLIAIFPSTTFVGFKTTSPCATHEDKNRKSDVCILAQADGVVPGEGCVRNKLGINACSDMYQSPISERRPGPCDFLTVLGKR